jgi:hypothetical protein
VERRRGRLAGAGTLILVNAIREKLARVAREEVGDVPGWVLISLMTAGLVIAIWAIAGPALGEIFQSALDRVTGF